MATNDTIPFIDDLIEDFNKVQEKLLPNEPTTAQNLSVHLTKILTRREQEISYPL